MWLAVRVLETYRPKIIGITGSVGKTSTKEAAFAVLSMKYRVRKTKGNYNNELGVPLTIIGRESPGKNVIGWMMLFIHTIKLILVKDTSYPEVVLLEMGADHPGDIKYLTSHVQCQVGVLTAIAPVHLEFFKKIENVIKEKQILIESLPVNGFAIINGDDVLLRQTQGRTDARLLTYGLNTDNDVQAREIKLSRGKGGGEKVGGISFKLFYAGHSVPVYLPGVLGNHQVYTALAAATVGLVMDINLVDIAHGLQTFKPPKGRMNLIHGIKDTLIIDDTYNSSPAAVKAGLKVLSSIVIPEGARRLAVLGEMLELGEYTEQGHREVGHAVAEANIDYLVCVGERARDIVRGAKEAGMSEQAIQYFDDTQTAGKYIQNWLKQHDLLLVKGSQGVRMEKIVKELMTNPELAGQLLVRQGEPWK